VRQHNSRVELSRQFAAFAPDVAFHSIHEDYRTTGDGICDQVCMSGRDDIPVVLGPYWQRCLLQLGQPAEFLSLKVMNIYNNSLTIPIFLLIKN
jgi:hypothetical protein